MLLTQDELNSLVGLTHRSPHSLLSLHPLGGRSGVVARAFLPDAAAVELHPVHEPARPVIPLQRIHESGIFEGATDQANEVYAYEFLVSDTQGKTRRIRDPYSFLPSLSQEDLYLFGKGDERNIYDKLGAKLRTYDGVHGASFAVWAPNAHRVSVVGDFNQWDGRYHAMRLLGSSGVWEIFIPGVGVGAHYKFEIREAHGAIKLKTDPYGFFFEIAPKQAAIVWENEKFEWTDSTWMEERKQRDPLHAPLSIYEIHIGSWQKKSESESWNYRELAGPLVEYIREMGFTHVEFMPVAEHAYYPSWGYLVTGFYAPSSRYGTPEDFQYLINALHEASIGVIVDWVPAHFPQDDWALARFDGTALYEHEDPRKGLHQDWGTYIFNFGRHEVRNFLIANALYWLDRFHIDGLRVDAVASMLYLDYSRRPGEWVPNTFGGRENLDAIEFLKNFNYLVHTQFPGAITIAEESTAWPMVTRPPSSGGLGFSFKWNMGWMHDTLDYCKCDPIFRKHRQNDLTFAMLYHHDENFVLPLSHDEVVHGKASLLSKMPGDDWQKFANLRTLFAYQWTFPGKKLLFMGGEIGQWREWNENGQIDWHLVNEGGYHRGLQRMVSDLNHLYLNNSGLWYSDYDQGGFYWIDCNDKDNSVFVFARQESGGRNLLVVVLNMTPVLRCDYRLGLPRPGRWREIFNSDASIYGGGNRGNLGGVWAEDYGYHHQPHSALFALPPLSVSIFMPENH